MASVGGPHDERSSPWPWVWAGVLVPLICIGPLVGGALLSAATGSDYWYFLGGLVAPSGVLSAVISTLFGLTYGEDGSSRAALVIVGLVGSGLAVALGLAGMEAAVHIACDPYDCF